MPYVRYLQAFVLSGVQQILYCVFAQFVLCVAYHMLPVSLYCQFLIAPSVFSNVYLPPVNTDNSLKLLTYNNKTFT
jgi:hypothetical protein